MKAYLALAVIGLMSSTGCSKDDSQGVTRTTSAEQVAPDNTKVNARDKAPTYTPIDQGNDPLDIRVTREIRQAIIDDPSLSFDAKNVKIITNNGFVILRGPVKSADERDKIHAAASAATDGGRLDDELEVEMY
jgi:hyperosmotically inducible protein